MLRERVQTEALRTYLFAYGLHYTSMSLDQLADSFQLPDKKVRLPVLVALCSLPEAHAFPRLISPCPLLRRHSSVDAAHLQHPSAVL